MNLISFISFLLEFSYQNCVVLFYFEELEAFFTDEFYKSKSILIGKITNRRFLVLWQENRFPVILAGALLRQEKLSAGQENENQSKPLPSTAKMCEKPL